MVLILQVVQCALLLGEKLLGAVVLVAVEFEILGCFVLLYNGRVVLCMSISMPVLVPMSDE